VKHWQLALVPLFLTAAAQAHHIWILPEKPAGSRAKVVFSDDLGPDTPETVQRIAHTKLWLRDRAGKESALTWRKGDDHFALDVPGEGVRVVGGSCVYGVQDYDHRKRSKVPPYLLTYYPKVVIGEGSAPKAWDRLKLQIVSAVSGDEVHLRVLFQGKPAPKAEIRMHTPGETRKDLTTDDKGEIKVRITKSGNHGFQTRHIEAKAGEHDGDRYGEIRHHATLVLPLAVKPAGARK
jgi:uncharacterized GH25 family protein